MELDDRTTYQVYINSLLDSCRKKTIALQNILEITQRQERIIHEKQMDEEMFQQTLTEKGILIQQLEELDDGFQQIYERVRVELSSYQIHFQQEIQRLKEYITEITDLSVMIEAAEQRNKERIQVYIAGQRQEIKQRRLSNKTAYGYYKSINSGATETPFFYDKKK